MPQARITFFGNDHRSDSQLRLCSAASRGVWVDLMTFMMEAQPFGSLLINGKRPTLEQIAALTVTPLKVVRTAMAELKRNGVYSEDPDGTIYSRRMRRDAQRAAEAKRNGKLGGNPNLNRRHDGQHNRGDNPPPTEGLTPQDKAHGEGLGKEGSESGKRDSESRGGFSGDVGGAPAADDDGWEVE